MQSCSDDYSVAMQYTNHFSSYAAIATPGSDSTAIKNIVQWSTV